MAIFDHLDAVIGSFDTDFTTYNVISALAYKYPKEYAAALAQAGERPFRDLHLELSKQLKARTDIQSVASIKSVNMFGMTKSCLVWHKTS
ncbi:hypothetical protein TI04_13265 [Achromatium sp. WMS2]|nr:hypothetical protein TI04_13265 [Achromatium sp. WMS2]